MLLFQDWFSSILWPESGLFSRWFSLLRPDSEFRILCSKVFQSAMVPEMSTFMRCLEQSHQKKTIPSTSGRVWPATSIPRALAGGIQVLMALSSFPLCRPPGAVLTFIFINVFFKLSPYCRLWGPLGSLPRKPLLYDPINVCINAKWNCNTPAGWLQARRVK